MVASMIWSVPWGRKSCQPTEDGMMAVIGARLGSDHISPKPV
jgi:hypothetical protein